MKYELRVIYDDETKNHWIIKSEPTDVIEKIILDEVIELGNGNAGDTILVTDNTFKRVFDITENDDCFKSMKDKHNEYLKRNLRNVNADLFHK